MPTMKGNTSIAANSTNLTLLQDQDYEFLPYAAYVSLWASESATGLTTTFKGTAESLVSAAAPNIAAAAGRVQIDTDGLLVNEPLAAGTRLQLGATNSTGGAVTLNWIVEITRIPGY